MRPADELAAAVVVLARGAELARLSAGLAKLVGDEADGGKGDPRLGEP